MVGAGVNYQGALGQPGCDFSRGAMRKRQEDDVVSGKVLHGGVFQNPTGQAMEMRLQFP
jgi:hypothetical protein